MTSEHELLPEVEVMEERPCRLSAFKSKIRAFFAQAAALHSAHPNLYLLWCFLLPATVMMTVHAIYGVYPFGTNSVLVLDLNGQYVYFFEALRRAAYGDASFLYSFSRNLGGEFLGIYAYYLASPLSYIVCLFPKGMILEALFTMFVLKTGLCGLTFGIFLKKTAATLRPQTLVLFSACYALSGYGMIMQHNTMWTDCIILLPLVCLGVRALIREKKFKLYVASTAVALLANYYIGYMLCLFLVLYFFYCYFSKKPEEVNPYKEKLHFIRTGSRFAIFSVLSALISAFMLIAAYYSLQFGKTKFSSPNWAMEANFDILDFMTKFLPGSYDTVEPSGLPFVYCGILTIILIPIYFLSKKKERNDHRI